MDLELSGKVAVVTGASKGIGLAVVRAFAGRGRSRRRRRAHDRCPCRASPGSPRSRSTSYEPGGPERLVNTRVERHGRVDILVNNVGGRAATARRVPRRSRDADFERSLQLNFFAALRATRAAVAEMIKHGGGAIVNVASVNAFFHPDGLVIDYGAAKAALLNVAKALSQELGPKGIRINSVSPGHVATDLWLGDHGVAATLGDATGVDPAAVREQATAGSPTGRFTTPEEVADARRSARLTADGKRHRLQLRDRRRTRQDDVTMTRRSELLALG